MFKAIRTSKGIMIVAAAVALTVGSLGFDSSVASASKLTQTTSQMTAVKVAPAGSLSTFDTRSVLGGNIVLSPDSFAVIQAGATGDGPADQKECDLWANRINSQVESANAADSEAEASIWLEAATAAANAAMDRGCFLY